MRVPAVDVLAAAVLGWVGTSLAPVRRGGGQAFRRTGAPSSPRPQTRRAQPGHDLAVVTLMASLSLAGCSLPSGPELRVKSPDLRDGAPLAERFTCNGENAVPTLRWTGGPSGVAGWAIVVEGPDAPAGTFTHWVVTGLPPGTRSVGPQLPEGAVAGLTSSGRAGYVGPCPPNGQEHRFRYRVHALSEPLVLAPATPVAAARRRIETLSLDAAEIEVTYRPP